jgi:hypothetical protein
LSFCCEGIGRGQSRSLPPPKTWSSTWPAHRSPPQHVDLDHELAGPHILR